jgi:16S rRNA processing protein RimM
MNNNEVSESWICLGRVLRAHGVKGALHIKLGNPHSESLRVGLQIHLRKKNGLIEHRIVKSVINGRILQLIDLEDRNVAEKLSQAEIYVDRSDFPALADDEIYLNDMMGFEVVDLEGHKIGSIRGFSDNGAQLLVDVLLPNHKHGLIPYVKPLIQKVDQASRQIIVDLPPGLFVDD